MRKGLLIAGIIFVVGMLMMGGAYMLGKILRGDAKESTIWDNVSLVLRTGDTPMRSIESEMDGEGFITIQNESVEKIRVSVGVGKIALYPVESKFFSYKIVYPSEKIKKRINAQVVARGDTLTVSSEKRQNYWLDFFSVYKDDLLVLVRFPKDRLFSHVTMENGVNTLRVQQLKAETMQIDTGVGEVSCIDVSAQKARIEVGVGSASFTRCEFSNTVLKGGVGEITFDGKLLKKTRVEMGIGQVNLNITDSIDNYSIEASRDIGAVYINNTRKSSSFGSVIQQAKNPSANNAILIDSNIGSIHINFDH